MGEILRAQGEQNQAIEKYQKAIEIDPIDAQSRYRLAYLYAERGDLKKAVRQLKAVLRLQPDHPRGQIIRRDITSWEK